MRMDAVCRSAAKSTAHSVYQSAGAISAPGFFIPYAGRKGADSVKKIAIIMGSDNDWPVVRAAAQQLETWEIPYEAHILSAHRTPEAAARFAAGAAESGFGVIIAAAGMAAHLAGVLAAGTTLPVIGIPMRGGAMDGLDALLATVQMPSGIPVATVALNGAKNAAVLAAQILALSDDRIAALLWDARQAMRSEIAEKDARLQQELNKLS